MKNNMDQLEKYIAEISSALCRMSPIERNRMMEVLRIAFPEYFKNISRMS